MSIHKKYWLECIASAAEDCDLTLTDDQLDCLAEGAMGGHECYGMAFYEPPPSERLSQINREHEERYKRLEAEFSKYRDDAETAVKRALGQYGDTQVTIGEHGEVLRHGGRTERIQ